MVIEHVPANDPVLLEDIDQMETISTELGWVAHRRLEQELERFHLTVPQYMALRCIESRAEGCSMSELAESAYEVSATMTGIVDRLVYRGLVQRERDLKDRRTLRVELTDAGKQLVDQVSRYKRTWLRDFLVSLSPEERAQMLSLAQRYLDRMAEALSLG